MKEDRCKWYCVRSQPKHEHVAASHLRVLNGVEVFCPRLRFRRMTKRGPVWFTEALFPGYVFARFDRLRSQKEVTYSAGVTQIVSFSGEPAAVPASVIEELRAQMGNEELKEIDEPIREGSNVTVATGVFKGLSTVVTKVMPAGERVRILLEFLGECREVELAPTALVPDRPGFLNA